MLTSQIDKLTAQAEAAEPLPQDELLVSLLALAVRDPGPVAGEEPERLTVDVSPARVTASGGTRRRRPRPSGSSP